MKVFESLKQQLAQQPKTWLVTGVGGFIGSNLMEALLQLNQRVIGLDNFATGHRHNIDEVLGLAAPDQAKQFTLVEGDLRSLEDCQRSVKGVDYVLSQAALGSVPRSIRDPLTSNAVNVTGFLNILTAAKDAGVKKFVYASSSAVYGDSPILPKVETHTGNPLSPYAVSKYTNELYARAFANCYDIQPIGLRYFNVFGARQDPNSTYAAVMPAWVSSLLKGEPTFINGDGETTRDFCYIENVIQMNLLAATTQNSKANNQIYNVSVGGQTSLNRLYQLICQELGIEGVKPTYRDFRAGDIRHSLADISKAQELLGYQPTHSVEQGLKIAMDWYVDYFKTQT